MTPVLTPTTLSEVLADFSARWHRGEVVRVEDYLESFSVLETVDILELIYQEYCLAEAKGQAPDPNDYVRRFPEHAERLRRLFGLHQAVPASELQRWATPADLPQAGDTIGPYHLLRALGEGAFARVFLAEQADLGDRLVVLKVSARPSPEPRLLARARHAHIVEVFWGGVAEDGALQLIGMPFLGGATLSAVLAERRRNGRRARSGRDLLDDLDRVAAPEYPSTGLAAYPARELLARLSYPKAIAWIVARLAEALDHAHRCGVAHGDLKPSNILLAADGSPKLFDFNLAVDWHLNSGLPGLFEAGGTLAYMAPERLRAIAEPAFATTPRPRDRLRADLYSLGLILREALTGEVPDLPPSQGRSPRDRAAVLATLRERSAWSRSARVPAPLQAILTRCLAPDPADRYGSAAELAEDLDRWRNDRPLLHTAEPGGFGTLGRWARRRRAALIAAALCVIVGLSAAVTTWNASRGSLRELAEARLAAIWDRPEPGVFRFVRYHSWDQRPSLDDPVETARHLLACYEALGPKDWRQREDVRALLTADREDLDLWLLEQTWRYARALADRPDSPEDWRLALACLERTLNRFALAPFEAQRRLLRRRLGLPEPAAGVRGPAAPRWIEQYLLGVEAEPSQASRALAHYREALRERPGSFWAHYRASAAAFRLGDLATAVEYLDFCVARRPSNPALRTQIAGCLFHLGRLDEALAQCNQALALDPEFREAYRTRAFLWEGLGHTDHLQSDLNRFALLTRSQGQAPFWKVRFDLSQADSAFETPEGLDLPPRILAANPEETDVRALFADRLAVRGRTDEALAEYNHVLNQDPDHLPARYRRGMLLCGLDHDAATRDFSTLIEHPRLEELLRQDATAIRSFHHVSWHYLLKGQVSEAVAIAQRGVDHAGSLAEPHLRAESHYALARALTLAARTDPALLSRAADHFRQARDDYGQPTFDREFQDDPLIESLRPALLSLLDRR
jgi:serine/threonine protein kinase/tetratricopeptide (TPR) repeat protein